MIPIHLLLSSKRYKNLPHTKTPTTAHDAEEVHTVDTNGRVVLNSEVDVLKSATYVSTYLG